MRAIGVTELGGPEALQVLDVPEPHAGPGEIRIRVHAAAVNPADSGLRAGLHGPRPGGREPPFIPGMDAAGVVDEAGDSTRFSVGDQVMAIAVPTRPHGGAYADELVVPAASAVPLPDGADFVGASTLPMNGLTAWTALRELRLPKGATVAVTGAAGAFGGFVVQLAKARGLRVLADAAERDEDLVHRLGADVVVRRGDGVADRFRALVPEGVDGLADGAVQNAAVAPAVRDGGGMVVVRGWNGDPGRHVTVHRVMVMDEVTNTAGLDELRRLAGEGILSLRVADVLRPEDAPEAHRRLEAGGVRGRLVLDFSS